MQVVDMELMDKREMRNCDSYVRKHFYETFIESITKIQTALTGYNYYYLLPFNHLCYLPGLIVLVSWAAISQSRSSLSEMKNQ